MRIYSMMSFDYGCFDVFTSIRISQEINNRINSSLGVRISFVSGYAYPSFRVFVIFTPRKAYI